MTHAEAQAAVMITDIYDVEEILDEMEAPEEPTLDNLDGEELLLGVTKYA
jgi:hypothetical protein